MIGNSLKSDVLPLVRIGASAIHIPFHTTWVHEEVSKEEQSTADYKTVSNIKEVLTLI
jgi:putative hydrolase of the HAD superfamily